MAALHDADALLIYQVGPVRCCAPTDPIEQIVMPPDLTHPPGSDAARPGIFKHGRHIVSVIDLRQRFGIAPENWQSGRLVITVLARGYTAFWVDRIVDVIRMPTEGWGGLPPHLPREAFSRTLLHANQIHLYTELEQLHKLHPAGFLRQYIAHLEQQQATPAESKLRSERQPAATTPESRSSERPQPSRSAPAAPRPASQPPVTRPPATTTRPASSSSTASARPALRTDPATKPGAPILPPQTQQPDETAQGVSAPRPAPPAARSPASTPPSASVIPEPSANRAGEAAATTSTRVRDPDRSAGPTPSLASRAEQPLIRPDETRTESSGLLALLLILLLLAGLGIGGYLYLIPEPTATLTRTPPPAPRDPIAVVAPTPPPHVTEPSPSTPLPESEPEPAPDPAPKPAPTASQSLNEAPGTPLTRNPLAGLTTTAPPYRASIEQDETGITLIFEQPDPVIPPLSNKPAPARMPAQEPPPDSAITDPVEPAEVPQNGQADAPAPPSREKIVHIVEQGDTLWDIASRYINNPWRYPELAENSDIRNPNLIYPGDRVRIIIYRGRRP